MSVGGVSYVPPYVHARAAGITATEWCGQFRAMASDITLRVGPGTADPAACLDAVESVFRQVEEQCTRFDPLSDLMRANDAGEAWLDVGEWCFAAISAAVEAHMQTSGRFDPRVLSALRAMGYDRSIAFGTEPVELGPYREGQPAPRSSRSPWSLGLDRARRRVRVGPDPIDLGGIGKGLAVRWAAERIATSCRSFVLDAGGDCYLAGDRPGATGWNVGVEDPRGHSAPVAVLAIRDAGCATSSIRLRHWTNSGRPAHHLIDPRTGAPGGAGLLSVTVVDSDPATAEVWSKVLFLAGVDGIAAAAAAENRAALWVAQDGTIGRSPAIEPFVIWLAR